VVKGVTCVQGSDMCSRVWYMLFETVICALIVMCSTQYM
jgi:hypothetical protein